jgi:hypothetical protein
VKALAGRWLTGVLLLVAGSMLWSSFGLSRVSGFIPRAVLSATCFVLAGQLVHDLWRAHSQTAALEPERQRGRERVAAAWGLVLLLGVWLFGVVVGSMLFCLAWMRWHAGERWPVAVGLSSGVGALLWLVFGRLPGPGPYVGLLGELVF